MDLIEQGKDLFDRIEAYYLFNKPLSPKEKEIAERYETAFALFLHHRNRKSAVAKLMKLEAQAGRKLSVAQAYRDMTAAEKIFAPIQQYSKEFLRLTVLESALRDVKEAERRARKATSINEWKKIMEIKNKAEYRVIQVSGLTEYNADLPDFSKIQPADIKIDLPEGVAEMFQKIISTGNIDVTDFYKQNASEAEIEDDSTED